jgi:hypothetical protein
VNQLPKSVVREIRTPRSVGAGGGRPPPATRWEELRGSPLSRCWMGGQVDQSERSASFHSVKGKHDVVPIENH